ncbi:DnaJ domain protein [Botrimarina colliarenosi]|uniref:DnaJ domain protein n=1 Tax=Botrimarina colliarenosi TaxID=2528001 RepID=A0A5C6A7R0_9BACT|nr:J domain-containing protein [Botrimarina colliarenosi]TWT95355.1 DnaJ domain protein [Botrimarina colliarenosi]
MIDPIDTLGVIWFVGLFLGLPLLGWLAMVVDYRAYLHSLKRALVVVRTYRLEVPLWALRDRPECLRELGLAPDCTRDEVMAAYRQRVKLVHPDHGGDRRRFELLQQRLQEALRLVEKRDG